MTAAQVPFAFARPGELPAWDSPAHVLDVEVHHSELGRVVDLVTLVYRYTPDNWFVITGHSGVKHCARCGQEITPLESLVMDLGPAPAVNSPKYPRLLHGLCYWYERRFEEMTTVARR